MWLVAIVLDITALVPPPLKFGPMGPLVDPTFDYKYECLYHVIVSIIST